LSSDVVHDRTGGIETITLRHSVSVETCSAVSDNKLLSNESGSVPKSSTASTYFSRKETKPLLSAL
jgi:hypothetical protein